MITSAARQKSAVGGRVGGGELAGGEGGGEGWLCDAAESEGGEGGEVPASGTQGVGGRGHRLLPRERHNEKRLSPGPFDYFDIE